MKKLTNYFITVVVLFIITVGSAYGQSRGIIAGKVLDEAKNALPGAAVVIKGTTQGASTTLNGDFTIRNVEEGETEIAVNYLGYKEVVKKVTVVAGETVAVEVILSQSATDIGDVVVSTIVDGQQRALNQQKAADNMTQVVSADQMGRFPDLNVAEALQRLSGVTITRARGEGAEIQLRGTPASFVNIQVNGEQMMGVADAGERNATLDVIPSDILASMEVQKTLLPSNDGDAIAGVVNLRTATARSLKARGSVDVSTGYNVLREKMPFNGKVGWQKRFAPNDKNPNGRFGIAANASYYRTYNGYDRLEAKTWLKKDILDSDGKKIEDRKEYVPTDFRYRYQEGTRTRVGGTLTLDYSPNLHTKIVLSGMYNNRHEKDTRYRRRMRYRGDMYDMGDGKLGTDRVQTVLQVTDQDIEVYNYNINLDGETALGNWKLDGGVFFSQSEKDAKNAQYNFVSPDWRANNKAIKNTDDGTGKEIKIPKNTVLAQLPSYSTMYLKSENLYTPAHGGALDDPSRMAFDLLENNDNVVKGRNITVRGNASYDYFIGNEFASTLSFGVKGKFMYSERVKPLSSTVYDVDYSKDGMVGNFMRTDNLSSKFLKNNLNFGPAPSLGKIEDYVHANPDKMNYNEFRTNYEADANFFEADEDIFAAYVMNRTQFNKVMAIMGVRVERTGVSYKANSTYRYNSAVLDLPENVDKDPHYNGGQVPGDNILYDTYINTPRDSTQSYVKVLPNIQFKFDAAKNTILRLAWTTGYSRPNFSELVPTVDVNQDLNKVVMGNPNLKPAYAHNLDLLFEHYMSRVGLISGGFFYKSIDKFLYKSEGVIDDPSNPYWNPMTDDQMVMIQSMNGKSAYVYGVEVTLNSVLSFMPGILKNLVFTSNYTYTNSKAKTETRGNMRFPGQAAHTANISLAYSSKRLTLQASANFNGDFMYSIGTSKDEDLWVDKRWQLDLNGSFLITKGLTFYAEATNILDTKAMTYMGNRSRVYDLEFTGAFLRFGMSYRF